MCTSTLCKHPLGAYLFQIALQTPREPQKNDLNFSKAQIYTQQWAWGPQWTFALMSYVFQRRHEKKPSQLIEKETATPASIIPGCKTFPSFVHWPLLPWPKPSKDIKWPKENKPCLLLAKIQVIRQISHRSLTSLIQDLSHCCKCQWKNSHSVYFLHSTSKGKKQEAESSCAPARRIPRAWPTGRSSSAPTCPWPCLLYLHEQNAHAATIQIIRDGKHLLRKENS